MKHLSFLFTLVFISCCPCKKVEVDQFQIDKANYIELLRKGKITDCEYYDLLIGAYEMKESREKAKKKKKFKLNN